MKTITRMIKENSKKDNIYLVGIVMPLLCVVSYGILAAIVHSIGIVLPS